MQMEEQEAHRVLLEVIPGDSLLAALGADADLAGNPHAADQLSEAGMLVDSNWPAQELGPSQTTITSRLAGRPRFDVLKDSVNKVGHAVNRLADNLPLDVQIPSWNPERQTVLFRASLPPEPDAAAHALAVASGQAKIVGVFNDPVVAIAHRRHNSPAHGTVDQVAELMNCDRLRAEGMTGEGVPVVIVDSGINLEHLRTLGRGHVLDEDLSYVPERSAHRPGEFPVGHGTLAAFQVGIAAPEAALADLGVIGHKLPTTAGGLMKARLSDIHPAYAELHRQLLEVEPAERRLVVSNSWAMINPDWDFPLTHAENFSDNPEHPFNRMVQALVGLGADVVFAAGNCGEPDQVWGCGFDSQPICGANSLDEVITVGAVDVDGVRLGYSSQGPGRIVAEKPDLCGYSHYAGSGITRPADWGTSTACPAVAGVVAAVRSRYSAKMLSPKALKRVLLSTASREPGMEHNPDTGYGIVNPAALLDALR